MKNIMLYLILVPFMADAVEKVWTYNEDGELFMSKVWQSPGSETKAYGVKQGATSAEIFRMSTGAKVETIPDPSVMSEGPVFFLSYHQYWIDSDDGWELTFVVRHGDPSIFDFYVYDGSTQLFKRADMDGNYTFFLDENSTYVDLKIDDDGLIHDIYRLRDDVVATSPVTPGKRYGSGVHSAFFNGAGNVRVHMELPSDQKAAFSLYNAKGACLNKTKPEDFKAGTHAVDVKVEKTANGVYYLKSDIGEKSDTKKVTRVK